MAKGFVQPGDDGNRPPRPTRMPSGQLPPGQLPPGQLPPGAHSLRNRFQTTSRTHPGAQSGAQSDLSRSSTLSQAMSSSDEESDQNEQSFRYPEPNVPPDYLRRRMETRMRGRRGGRPRVRPEDRLPHGMRGSVTPIGSKFELLKDKGFRLDSRTALSPRLSDRVFQRHFTEDPEDDMRFVFENQFGNRRIPLEEQRRGPDLRTRMYGRTGREELGRRLSPPMRGQGIRRRRARSLPDMTRMVDSGLTDGQQTHLRNLDRFEPLDLESTPRLSAMRRRGRRRVRPRRTYSFPKRRGRRRRRTNWKKLEFD